MTVASTHRVALIEAGSPGLNIYSHVAMGRGVPLLATVLRDAGVTVRAFVEDISGKDSIDWEYVRSADVIGFSAITCTLTRTAELISRARAENPGTTIVLGGPEPTCAPDRSFEVGADYVIRGEAELSLLQLLLALESEELSGMFPGEAVRAVSGIVWRDSDGLHYGPKPRQLTRDELDALPLIDMSLVEGSESRTTGLAWRSRGCPERCAFCEVHEIWPRYVLRDERRSAEELLRSQNGSGGAFLIDDNSAANKPSFKRFLRSVIEGGYSRPIAVQLRADAVVDHSGGLDHELLRLLKDVAPVTMLCIGVESASDDDLAAVGKRESSEHIAQALKAMKRHGLLVHGMFIAFTDDTVETLKRNGRFARDYVTSLQYLFETPLPGTKSTREHEAAGRLLFREIPELKYNDGMHVAIRPTRISAKAMQEAVTAEYRRFYSRARIFRAFLSGLFRRHRRLGAGQLAYLRTLRPMHRLKEWAWLHLQFKFAPWAMLRIGRARVLAFFEDPDYTAYLRGLSEDS